jgi:UDP-N-acetylglucosamine acyltransferase
MSTIHPTAIVKDGATLGNNVTIGPYCVIGSRVTLQDDVHLESHVAVAGQTSIGEKTHIFPFASIGHSPQDLKYAGEKSRLEIGARNIIREYVTLQPGTDGGGLVTSIGNDCLFMACSHVAHDCKIGNQVILANNVMVAGHVELGNHVICGGGSGVHQFVRVGEQAFIGGMSGVENDVIPFGSAIGNRAHLGGLNLVGLKRRNFQRETIHNLRKAYRLLFGDDGTFVERVDETEETFGFDENVMTIINFIRSDTSRSFCTPRK